MMDKGGLENRLMELYRSIDKTKIQFDFYTFRKNEGFFDKEIQFLGGRIIYNNKISFLSLLNRFRDLEIFLKKSSYSTVHSHMNQWNASILKSAFRANIRNRISHSRTSIDRFSFKNLFRGNINRYSTLNLAVSEKAGIWLYGKRKNGMKNFTVIPNGLELKNFAYSSSDRLVIRNNLNLGENKTFIHVGNIKKEKNHTFLLSVFKKILIKNPSSFLLLVGKDHLQGSIQRLVKKLNIQRNVYFVGSTDSVNKYLSASDVFLFPSIYEGFPGAVIEAATNGLPCIISSNISPEVFSLPNVSVISIKDKYSGDWVSTAINAERSNDSVNDFIKITNLGYNISNLSTYYESIYLGLK
jgi:glycosyltransferase involved in cell wall biosynthesis